jgi:hypothetical protein
MFLSYTLIIRTRSCCSLEQDLRQLVTTVPASRDFRPLGQAPALVLLVVRLDFVAHEVEIERPN